MKHAPETPAIDPGLPRRTVLTGAAWTIPVIAAATIAPAATASGTLQLAFDKTTYNGTACSTIAGAYVTATTNGVPTTGATITVSLSNNYTFSGGSTTATGYSGTNGRYTLPDINVPASGGSGTLSAQSGSASASGAISASAKSGGLGWYDTARQFHAVTANIPTGSVPYGAWFLAPDGRLLNAADAAVKGTGIATVGPEIDGYFGVTLKNGGYGWYDTQLQFHTVTANIPANSVPYGGWFFTPDGRFLNAADGAVKGTGIATVGPVIDEYFAVTLKNGGYGWYDTSRQFRAVTENIPADSVPYGAWFLAPDGRLLNAADAAVKGTGIATVGPEIDGYFGVTLKNGGYGWYDTQLQFHTVTANIPANSVPYGGWFFTPDGRFLNAADGAVKGTGIATVGPVIDDYFAVTLKGTC
ncbi:hypothetical protein AB0O90_07375 [Microbacterium testaceum]|uniref:hypothetical protein n=1 Tax=Microbacterium testaceum TaxID=2033 RepID=UPI0034288268